MHPALGQSVLAVHLIVIAFNVAGLALIPLGAARGWRWVRLRWLRALHLASWLAVAVQAVLGRACVLTDWQAALTGQGAHDPLVMRWVNRLIYWPLPLWAFTALYLVLFAYAAWLWRQVPPDPWRKRPG